MSNIENQVKQEATSVKDTVRADIQKAPLGGSMMAAGAGIIIGVILTLVAQHLL